MAADTTECHSDGPSETCFCTADVQESLLTYFEAYTLPMDDLVSLPLAASLARLISVSVTAAVIGLLRIN